MDFSAINWLAIIVSILPGFALSFFWYGPLFGKPWMESVGLTEEKIQQNANMAKTFTVTTVLQLIMAFCMAMFFYSDPTSAELINAGSGAFYGFLTGFGWVATAIGVNAMFEQRSFTYVGIVGGYWIIVFTLMGLILGAWQ